MSPFIHILHTGPQLTKRALGAEPGDHSPEPHFITFLMLLSIDSPLNISLPLSWSPHWLPFSGHWVTYTLGSASSFSDRLSSPLLSFTFTS